VRETSSRFCGFSILSQFNLGVLRDAVKAVAGPPQSKLAGLKPCYYTPWNDAKCDGPESFELPGLFAGKSYLSESLSLSLSFFFSNVITPKVPSP
jgi:hypothetical protein